MAPVMFLLLPSKPPSHLSISKRLKQLDWLGAILVVSSLTLFILALMFGGNEFAWSSSIVLGFFIASAILALLFILSQTLLPYKKDKSQRLFRAHFFINKDMVLLSIATGAGTSALFLSIYYIPLFFQFTRGDSALKAAVRLLALIIVAIGFCIGGSGAIVLTGYHIPWYIFGGMVVIIGFSLLSTITPATSNGVVYGYLIIIGAGLGAFVQMGFAIAQAISPKTDTEASISFIMQGQTLGIIVGLAIAGSVFLNRATEGLAALFPDLPPSSVRQAIAGHDASFLTTLPPELQQQCLQILVQSMDRVFLLGIVGGQ